MRNCEIMKNHNEKSVLRLRNNEKPIYLFSTAPLVQQLSSTEIRLPPNSYTNYVGVRKVPTSSRGVAAKPHESPNNTSSVSSNIVFTVKDKDGNERRMTNQEKKVLKQKTFLGKESEKKLRKNVTWTDYCTVELVTVITTLLEISVTVLSWICRRHVADMSPDTNIVAIFGKTRQNRRQAG